MGVISDVGSVVSAVGGKNAQKAATNAANQDAAGESKAVGAEGETINDIDSSYFGPNGAQSIGNSLMQYLSGQQGQSYNSPYTSSANTAAGNLSNYGNANMTAASGTASQLQNFQGLKPQEMQALQTSLGNSGRSTVNTLMSQIGGTPNSNALAQSLLNSNNSNALNSTVQLGSQAAGQELSALQSAGQLQSGLSQQQLSGAQTGADVYGNLSQQNLNYGQGNNTTLSNLYGTATNQVDGTMGAEQNIANLYGQSGSAAAQTAASYGSPWGSALTQIGGGGSPFGGGGSSGAAAGAGASAAGSGAIDWSSMAGEMYGG